MPDGAGIGIKLLYEQNMKQRLHGSNSTGSGNYRVKCDRALLPATGPQDAGSGWIGSVGAGNELDGGGVTVSVVGADSNDSGAIGAGSLGGATGSDTVGAVSTGAGAGAGATGSGAGAGAGIRAAGSTLVSGMPNSVFGFSALSAAFFASEAGTAPPGQRSAHKTWPPTRFRWRP